jgi:hypothetical protein
MSTISHPPVGSVKEQKWSALLVREMWAALAIFAMWLAVAVSAVWGTDFVSTSGAGTNSTTIPSGIAVAMFATIGSWAVAKHGLAHRPKDGD